MARLRQREPEPVDVDLEVPAEGEDWRSLVDENDLDERLAHHLASLARLQADTAGAAPPVSYEPIWQETRHARQWRFTIDGHEVIPVQAIDATDAFLAALDDRGPGSNTRAWAWGLVLAPSPA